MLSLSKKYLVLFSFILLLVLPIYGQRYKQKVFDKIQIERNISYTSAAAVNTKLKYFLFDLYQPLNDTTTLRPLIIWLHGGGFKFGNKSSRGTPVWSKQFAQRGYVNVAANYRLSKGPTLSKRDVLIAACADAVEDIYKLIDFLKVHSKQYGIDTTKIILAGNSAGGIIALQAVYSNKCLMLPGSFPPNDDSCKNFNPYKITAIVNFWGGLFDSTWLENAKIPIVSVAGNKDRVVPFDNPTKGISGSMVIEQSANKLQIPNALKVYKGYGHELQKHFNPLWASARAFKRYKHAGDFAADFLYDILVN